AQSPRESRRVLVFRHAVPNRPTKGQPTLITRGHVDSSAVHPWVGARVPDMLAASAEKWPQRGAVLDADEQITYERLHSTSHDVARHLAAADVKEGDHVALFLGESWRQIALIYGILQLGAVVVPLNITWETDELAHGLKESDVSHLIAQGE